MKALIAILLTLASFTASASTIYPKETKMKHVIKTLIALIITISAAIFYSPAMAAQIGFTSVTPIVNANGTKTATVAGYRFETPSWGRLLIANGGLWDGSAFGVASPITITKIDSRSFALESIHIQNHASFGCGQACGTDSVMVSADNGRVSQIFKTTGVASSESTFVLTDPGFSNVTSVTISTPEAFILYDVGLSDAVISAPVPVERVISFVSAPVSIAPTPFNCVSTQPDGYAYATSMRITSGCLPAGVYSQPGKITAYAVGNRASYDMVSPFGTSFIPKSFSLAGALKGYPVNIWAYDVDGNLIYGDVLALKWNAAGIYDLSGYKLTGVTELQITATTRNALYLGNIDIVE